MDDGGADDRLAEAARVRREAGGLRARLDVAREQLVQAEDEVRRAGERLAAEDRDVQRQESLSWPRILAALKGEQASALEREQAERDAARYRLVEAETRRDVAEREVRSLVAQLDELGDVDAAFAEALAAKEEWVRAHDPAVAGRLTTLAVRRGEVAAEDREGREAFGAGQHARELLLDAARLLGSARSWSTWDTFGGGGMLTDMMKYDRLDQVTVVLRQADQALARFSRELADVRLAGVEAVNLDGMTRAFDVFFDNIFTDLRVRSRIQDAEVRVGRALDEVERTLQALSERGRELAQEAAAIEDERQRTLTG